MYCNKCGKMNEAGSKFCTHCGAPLGNSQAAHGQSGYNQGGYNQNGYHQYGYNQNGYNQNGYGQNGYNQNGYSQSGYNQSGYGQNGYGQNGYGQNGYNQNGYNQNGYNQNGYNQGGYNQSGYNQQVYNQNAYNPQGTVPAVKKQKPKKKSPVLAIVAGIVAFALGYGAVTGLFSGSEEKPEVPALPNPAYEAVFTDRGIVDVPSTFSTKYSAHYVSAGEDDMVEKLEFGYDDDLVKEMVNVVYLPLAAYSETERQVIDDVMRETFDSLNDHDFVTVRYEMGENYYMVSIRARELDKIGNLKVLKDIGFEAEGSLLSMKATDKSLQDNGYIKR